MTHLKVYKFTMDLDKYLDIDVPTIVFWDQTSHLFTGNSDNKRELYEPNELDMDNPFNIYLETNNSKFAGEFAKLIRLSPEEVENFDSGKWRKKFLPKD